MNYRGGGEGRVTIPLKKMLQNRLDSWEMKIWNGMDWNDIGMVVTQILKPLMNCDLLGVLILSGRELVVDISFITGSGLARRREILPFTGRGLYRHRTGFVTN